VVIAVISTLYKRRENAMNTLERLASLRNACATDGDRTGEIACFQVAATYATALQIYEQNRNYERLEDEEFEEEAARGKQSEDRPAGPRARATRGAKKCTPRRPRPIDKPAKEPTT
jgi:hypothetical protein